jgi:hypothetical protein
MKTRTLVLLLFLLATSFQQVFATSRTITLDPSSADKVPIYLNSGELLDVTFNANSINGPEAVTFALIFVNTPPAPNDTVLGATSVSLYSGSYSASKSGTYILTFSNESQNTVTVNLNYEVRTQSSVTVATPRPSEGLYQLAAAIVFAAGLIAFGLIWTRRRQA